MPDEKVRTHTRRTASGRNVTVRHHTRAGRPKRKRGPNPGHALRLGKKASAAGKRGRKGRAAMLGAVALIEVVLWLTLSTTSALFSLAGAILIGLSIILAK